jgi:hypothetical protein
MALVESLGLSPSTPTVNQTRFSTAARYQESTHLIPTPGAYKKAQKHVRLHSLRCGRLLNYHSGPEPSWLLATGDRRNTYAMHRNCNWAGDWCSIVEQEYWWVLCVYVFGATININLSRLWRTYYQYICDSITTIPPCEYIFLLSGVRLFTRVCIVILPQYVRQRSCLGSGS